MNKLSKSYFIGSEKDFVDSLEKAFIKKEYITRREVNIGNGVADLVLAKINKSNLNKRYRNNQRDPLLNEYYFQILRNIPDIEYKQSPIDINELESKISLSKSFLRYTAIRNLVNSGYIKNIGKQKYLKINGWLPIADEVIAIEAKLKNWKRGFIQASRYQVCADKVYLALPKETSHLPEVSLLRKFGVGLISYDASSEKIKILIEAKKAKINKNNDKRNYVSEYFLSKVQPAYITD